MIEESRDYLFTHQDPKVRNYAVALFRLVDALRTISIRYNDANTLKYRNSIVFEEPKINLTIVQHFQKDLMIEALQVTLGNIGNAAKMVQVSKQCFYKRMRLFGIMSRKTSCKGITE